MDGSQMNRLTRWGGTNATRRASVGLAAALGFAVNHPATARKRKKKKSCPSCATSSTALWAVVNSDGSLDRTKGATTSARISDGTYEIRFERDVDLCAYTVTLDHASGFAFISLIVTDPSPQIVGVTTLDRAGFVKDTQFHLVVNC